MKYQSITGVFGLMGLLLLISPSFAMEDKAFTESGRKMAEDTFGRDVSVIYAPIDFVGSVRKSLATVRPDVMVFLETEIWPTWLSQAHRMGIKTVLINGRISLKSVGGYLRLRLFFREVLKNFDAFSMIMAGDGARMTGVCRPRSAIPASTGRTLSRLRANTTGNGSNIMTFERGFPVSEFETRVQNAQAKMRAADMDALLFMSEREFTYFAGFQSNFWQSPTRPWFLILPAEGKPIAVIPSIGENALSISWIDDVRIWASPNPEDEGISLLSDTLKGLAKRHGRVGVPMGPETHLRMPSQSYKAPWGMLIWSMRLPSYGPCGW